MANPFRLLFVGDVVGPSAVSAVVDLLPDLRERLGLHAVVVNGENSAPTGRGVTPESARELLSVADFLTLGNHAFDAKGHEDLLRSSERTVRPANLPEGLPGRGWGVFEAGGVAVGVTNVLGRVFVERTPPLTSPFEAADAAIEELEASGADVVLVDSHAEATSEKQALGHHLAGRAGAVLGTHTHVPTDDLRLLAGGTAYVTDVGMVGCEESVVGFGKGEFLRLFLGGGGSIPVADAGPVIFNAVLVEIDLETHRAVGAERVRRVWSG